MVKRISPRLLIFLFILLPVTLFAKGKQETLTVGLMPAINSIPLIIAEHRGYFEEEGIKISLVMFKSQMYRESALQTGTIDGTISDLINAVNARSQGFPLTVTSYTDGDFVLLTAPDGAIRSLEDWDKYPERGIKTGLLENSIVYYVTERMLQTLGRSRGNIDLVSTLVLSARLEMLLSGQIDAACIPEPVATVAEKLGAIRLCDTGILPATPGVLLFSDKALKEKEQAVLAFYRAYNRAVEDLNRGFEEYRDIIIAKGEFPQNIRDTFSLPVFSTARVPTVHEFKDVVDWMIEKGLIQAPIYYESVVSPRFLPGHAGP